MEVNFIVETMRGSGGEVGSGSPLGNLHSKFNENMPQTPWQTQLSLGSPWKKVWIRAWKQMPV